MNVDDAEAGSLPPHAAVPRRHPSIDTAGLNPPRFAELRRGLLSAAIGFAAYYSARHLGAPPLEALVASTVVSALRVAYSAARRRTFDPIAGFLMAADGLTLVVGVLTQSAVITMVGGHVPGVVFEIFVIVGLARGRPVTESLLEWVRPGSMQRHMTGTGWNNAVSNAYHRRHVQLSVAVAVAGLLHLVAAAAVIFTLPVDVAKGILGLLALATDFAILAIVVGGIGQFLRHRRPPAKSSVGQEEG